MRRISFHICFFFFISFHHPRHCLIRSWPSATSLCQPTPPSISLTGHQTISLVIYHSSSFLKPLSIIIYHLSFIIFPQAISINHLSSSIIFFPQFISIHYNSHPMFFNILFWFQNFPEIWMKTINDQQHLHFFSRPSQLFMEWRSSVLIRLGIFQSWRHLHQFGREQNWDCISDQSRKKSLPAIHFITFQILRSNMQNNEKCIQPQSETRSTNISNELSFVEIPTTSLPY